MDTNPYNTTLAWGYYLDTWDGLTNCSMSSTGTAFANPLASVRMFWRDSDGAVGLQLTSAGGDITIDDAANWQYTVNPITQFPLAVGVWRWSIEFTDSAGRVKTYWAGTREIKSDPTY